MPIRSSSAVVLGDILVLLCPFYRAPSSASRTPLRLGAAINAPVSDLLRRTCKDSHSDNTEWPWYAHLPPVSWLVLDDVERGRNFFNLSKWDRYSKPEKLGLLTAIASAAKRGSMPPLSYSLVHSDVRLTDVKRTALESWPERERGQIRARICAQPKLNY